MNRMEMKPHLKNGVLPNAAGKPIIIEIFVKKKYRKRSQGSLTNAITMGHLHADTKDKLITTSENGEQYFVTIFDESSRLFHVKPIRNKKKVSNSVQEFVKWF